MKVSSLPRLNGAKFNIENRAYQHPVCWLRDDTYLLLDGWKVAGWSSAPYRGAGGDAIVYERTSRDPDGVFEVGKLYWAVILAWVWPGSSPCRVPDEKWE